MPANNDTHGAGCRPGYFILECNDMWSGIKSKTFLENKLPHILLKEWGQHFSPECLYLSTKINDALATKNREFLYLLTWEPQTSHRLYHAITSASSSGGFLLRSRLGLLVHTEIYVCHVERLDRYQYNPSIAILSFFVHFKTLHLLYLFHTNKHSLSIYWQFSRLYISRLYNLKHTK